MKKAYIALPVVMLGMLLLVACNKYDLTYPIQQASDNAPFENANVGFWDGNTFISQLFGLQFDLPHGWQTECAELIWTHEHQIAFYERLVVTESNEWTQTVFSEISAVYLEIICLGDDTIYYYDEYYIIDFERVRIGRYYWYSYHAISKGSTHWSDFFIETDGILKVITFRHTGADELEYILSHFRY